MYKSYTHYVDKLVMIVAEIIKGGDGFSITTHNVAHSLYGFPDLLLSSEVRYFSDFKHAHETRQFEYD